eukprot:626830-Prymnesium_polylepis.1
MSNVHSRGTRSAPCGSHCNSLADAVRMTEGCARRGRRPARHERQRERRCDTAAARPPADPALNVGSGSKKVPPAEPVRLVL